jgi:hypothetical protein
MNAGHAIWIDELISDLQRIFEVKLVSLALNEHKTVENTRELVTRSICEAEARLLLASDVISRLAPSTSGVLVFRAQFLSHI